MITYRFLHMISKYRYPQLTGTSRSLKFNGFRIIKASANTPTQQSVAPSFTHGSYGALLLDSRWRDRRAEILLRDKNRCVICESSEDLQVHHRQYHYVKLQNQFKPPWDYPDNLLITLCKSCHNRGHSKFKVPTLTI